MPPPAVAGVSSSSPSPSPSVWVGVLFGVGVEVFVGPECGVLCPVAVVPVVGGSSAVGSWVEPQPVSVKVAAAVRATAAEVERRRMVTTLGRAPAPTARAAPVAGTPVRPVRRATGAVSALT
ncbi:hypothetical protein EFL95_12540 [Nocardioides marmorisolisilvae]|uniref:Uncharacterized protein n=1 Tax=Nocardioides marmorisolisilvae TaxID=1542737 RepID=A0A3N0DVZ1_9ACTN|nr:hypothetical protein EFL95_12540 [Nocardioides marmorisolisilvae]